MISTSMNKKIYALITFSLVLFSQQGFAGWGTTATESSTQYTSLTTDAQRGRWIWLKNNCMGCHGDNGGGGMGPNVRFKEIGNIQDAVTGGAGGMPSFLNITASDMTMLTTYLNSIGQATEPKFICWWKSPINDLNYTGYAIVNGVKTAVPRPNCNP